MATPVSILMPCHNAERFVGEAVASVLGQTHGAFELLAINDGSSDQTEAVLRSWAARDARVRVISHPANIGMGRALNAALADCRYEWVARTDADDVMMPNRLERQLAFVADRPGLVVASSLVRYIDDTGAEIGQSRSDFTDPARVSEAAANHWLVGFHHPAVLMRRDVVRQIGGYRPQFWPADDADLWNRIIERHPGGVLVQPEYLMKYRIHGASVCVSRARLTARKTEWVADCVRQRRTGQPEPTWEQFLAARRRLPWPARLDRDRRELARTLYKAAVAHYASRRYARFLPAMAAAAALEPGYVLRRLALPAGDWRKPAANADGRGTEVRAMPRPAAGAARPTAGPLVWRQGVTGGR